MKRGLIFLAVIFPALVFSCSKSDPSNDPPALDGTLRITQHLPKYVTNGDEFLVIPYGVSVPGDSTKKVGYYWYLSTDSGRRDTSSLWDVVIPELDTLGTVTLYGYAYYAGYSTKSITSTAIIVNDRLDGKGSIRGFDIKRGEDSVKGPSGKAYYYISVGGKHWMRQNLAEGPLGVAYRECDVNSYIFGRYYSWDEALVACPDNWHLPSLSEWDSLLSTYPQACDLMADLSFNGTKMWEYWPKVKISDRSRFSAMPSGYATCTENGYLFQAMNKYAVFWTSDTSPSDSGFAVAKYIYEDRNEVFTSSFDKSDFLASVRCVRDAATVSPQ